MIIFRRTWLPTACFLVLSTAIWWGLGSWTVARKALLPTVILTPPIWWFVAGRQSRPHLGRGALGGAIAGLVTQSAQNVPDLWDLIARRGTFRGDEQATAMVSGGIFLLIGACGAAAGTFVGVVAAAIQRRMEDSGSAS